MSLRGSVDLGMRSVRPFATSPEGGQHVKRGMKAQVQEISIALVVENLVLWPIHHRLAIAMVLEGNLTRVTEEAATMFWLCPSCGMVHSWLWLWRSPDG